MAPVPSQQLRKKQCGSGSLAEQSGHAGLVSQLWEPAAAATAEEEAEETDTGSDKGGQSGNNKLPRLKGMVGKVCSRPWGHQHRVSQIQRLELGALPG